MEQVSTPEEINTILDELWNELHHQGDVGLASYYAVPHLVRMGSSKGQSIYSIVNLVVTIEIERHRNNPALPSDLVTDYEQAIFQLGELGKSLINQKWDLQLAATSLSAIAISKGQIGLAKALIILEDDSTLDEFLNAY